nr:NepR family anti-sigma factor [Sphingomonas bacterium]
MKGARAGDRTGSPSVQGDVGTALRSAYEQTVSENIPSEMLDLLGKLA